MLTVGSTFSGIGGVDLAFERAGAKVVWNCEIDSKCRQVLQRHWPGTPRFKDVKTVTGSGLGAAGLRPDCLAGGFPCQDLSVAGARAGLAGERSGLFFEFARLLEETQPQWFLLENVPGLLSSAGGRDMGVLLSTLVNLGYGVAWRVLDAQYFGVAQRRRRVFIVGCAGDRARAAQVLLEPEGGGGDPPARRAAGEESTPSTGGCVAGDGEVVTGLTGSFGNGVADDNKAQAGWLVPVVSNALVAPSTGGYHFDPNGEALVPVAYRKATKAHHAEDWERWEEAERADALAAGGMTTAAHAVVQPVAFHMTQDPITGPISPAIGGVKAATGYSTVGIAYGFQPTAGMDVQAGSEISPPVKVGSTCGAGYGPAVAQSLAVRRLTPMECLRLQGFPDDWLDDLGLADSVKYRMAGNAVAVPVVVWLARRMVAAHAL